MKIQPIGIDHHIPFTPITGIPAKEYESTTLVPKETIVRIRDIPGFSIALKNPNSGKEINNLFPNKILPLYEDILFPLQ